jgi:C-terminal processing protease CtpA/Prc
MAVGEAVKLASPDRPWVAELLPGPIAYWRVRTMGATLAEAMGRDWAAWRQKNPLGAVLDLRECLPAQSLEAAAEVCALFVTPGEVLFSWRDGVGKEKVFRSDRQPLGLSPATPLVVLVGPNLRGAGELVATVLQERAGAILLGQATAGQAGWLAESRLSTGRSLFRARGEILLPGGQAGSGRPLPPDVVLSGANHTDAEIWMGGEMTIASTIAEVPAIRRARESALINEDEEVEEIIASSLAEKELEVKRPPQDRGLQRAGDLLRALRKMPPSRRA